MREYISHFLKKSGTAFTFFSKVIALLYFASAVQVQHFLAPMTCAFFIPHNPHLVIVEF